MANNELIAIITEGSAETAIMELLLDNQLLVFSRQDLFKQKILRTRSASQFQKLHLNSATRQKIHIYRILDSRNEHFKLGKAYEKRISKIDSLYTRPEIEILYIINENQYDAFKRSGLKAHDFVNQCITTMPKGSIKTYDYVISYWEPQLGNLVNTIQEYASKTTDPFSNTLASILV